MMDNNKLLILLESNNDIFKIGQVLVFSGIKSTTCPHRYTTPKFYYGDGGCILPGSVDVSRCDDNVSIEHPETNSWWHFKEVLPENLTSIEVRTCYGTGDLSYNREHHHWTLKIQDTLRKYKEDDISFVNNKVYVLDKTESIYVPLERFYLTGTVKL